MQETLADVEAISRAHDGGTDVLFYGEHFFVANESVKEQYPAVPNWLNRMPLSWYLERGNATVDSANEIVEVDGQAPVVITRAKHYEEVDRRLDGYVDFTYELTSSDTETVFFIDETALERVRQHE
jgi:predicted membrane-bound mannosyltransferase